MISSTKRVPLWSMAREVRNVIDPSVLGDHVVHYSIPSVDESGTGQREETKSIRSAKLTLRGGEILISKLNPRKSRIVHVDRHDLPAVASTEFVALLPLPDVEPRFLAYALESETVRQELDSRVQSVTRSHQRATPEDVTHLPIWMPNKEEQRRIADFLDAETTRIDRLISAKNKSAELLDERRVALATRLCLRGLSSKSPLKDSGIDPIGEIPRHWQVLRNKTFIRESEELSTDGSEELLTVSHITGVTPRSEKVVYMFQAESMEGYKICRPGDLIINTLWAWMGALGVSNYFGIVSPAYGVYRFTSIDTFSKYFDYLYRTPAYVAEMTSHSKGVWSSRLRLYPESFLSLKAPIPPLREQQEIANTLDKELESDSRLQSTIRRSVALLTERRQALITAAVTGRFDVSTASGRGVTE